MEVGELVSSNCFSSNNTCILFKYVFLYLHNLKKCVIFIKVNFTNLFSLNRPRNNLIGFINISPGSNLARVRTET